MTTYQQNNQSVNNQTNIGRDQVIHNLVLVGQFLDFAKVEGLIPKAVAPSDFSTIIDAFERTFDQRLGSDLAQATASAGVILSGVMLKYVPKQQPAALPSRTILLEVPNVLFQKFVQLGFWNTFYEPSYVSYRPNNNYEPTEVVWLYSHQMLWKKYFKRNELFGIAKPRNNKERGAFLCTIPLKWQASTNSDWLRESITTKQYAEEVSIDDVNYEQFRIMMAGLTVDLIRMCSIASTDIQFWQGLISLMNIK